MPLFLVETTDGKIRQVLRAACTACARSVAVQAAREEGTAVWRDPSRSTVKEIQPDGPVKGVILRSETE
ncbi:hypothetical protein D3C77_48830 [compost metagenome]